MTVLLSNSSKRLVRYNQHHFSVEGKVQKTQQWVTVAWFIDEQQAREHYRNY